MIPVPQLRSIHERLDAFLDKHIGEDAAYADLAGILTDFAKLLPLPTVGELGWSQSLVGRWAEIATEYAAETVYDTVLIIGFEDDDVIYLTQESRTATAPADEVTPLPEYLPVTLTPVPVDEVQDNDRERAAETDHPQVLNSMRDFRAAPEGTIVTCEDLVATRIGVAWYSAGNGNPLKAKDAPEHMAPALVLRWGMGGQAHAA